MKTDIIVGLGSCGIASGAQEVYDFFEKNIGGSDVALKKTSCIGICFQEPIVEVVINGVKTAFGKVDTALTVLRAVLNRPHHISSMTKEPRAL